MLKRVEKARVVLCVIVLLLLAWSPGHKALHAREPLKETRVLFIGNSYTFFNALPDMFAQLAQSGGYTVSTAMAAIGGWTLAMHAKSKRTMGRLTEQAWDYVVLQEQSIIPSQAQQREKSMYPAVRLLKDAIDAVGADTILFMTWGHRDGLAEEGFHDFAAMQAELERGYLGIADELEVMVAPVGTAWENGITKDPQMDLWMGDGSHPDVHGSYLAACVFYAVIFQQSPEGLGYTAGLPKEVGRFLQTIATETVLADIKRWNIQ